MKMFTKIKTCTSVMFLVADQQKCEVKYVYKYNYEVMFIVPLSMCSKA